MSEYVYEFVHPTVGILYIGRTKDIDKRIKQHLRDKNDNIDRSYADLLSASDVYFLCLANKAESIAVEAYLINKHKPELNRAMIYESSSESVTMNLPPFTLWKQAIVNTGKLRVVDEEYEPHKTKEVRSLLLYFSKMFAQHGVLHTYQFTSDELYNVCNIDYCRVNAHLELCDIIELAARVRHNGNISQSLFSFDTRDYPFYVNSAAYNFETDVFDITFNEVFADYH